VRAQLDTDYEVRHQAAHNYRHLPKQTKGRLSFAAKSRGPGGNSETLRRPRVWNPPNADVLTDATPTAPSTRRSQPRRRAAP
jgi:hypothetical protein